MHSENHLPEMKVRTPREVRASLMAEFAEIRRKYQEDIKALNERLKKLDQADRLMAQAANGLPSPPPPRWTPPGVVDPEFDEIGNND